jgi:hypothetical protein
VSQGPVQLGGSLLIDFLKFFEDCSSRNDIMPSQSESHVRGDPVYNLSNSPKLESSFCSPCCSPCNSFPPQLVPLCSSNPIGHVRTWFFEPCEHLLLCPVNPVNEQYDAIDWHFHVVDSLVCSKREVIDLDSPPPSGTVVSLVQLNYGNGSCQGLKKIYQ